MIASKQIKHLGMNLTKQVKDVYAKNYKTLIKDITGNKSKCKDILCSRIRRINIVKIPKLSKALCRFNTISINMPMVFFTELKTQSKICVKLQRLRRAKATL